MQSVIVTVTGEYHCKNEIHILMCTDGSELRQTVLNLHSQSVHQTNYSALTVAQTAFMNLL